MRRFLGLMSTSIGLALALVHVTAASPDRAQTQWLLTINQTCGSATHVLVVAGANWAVAHDTATGAIFHPTWFSAVDIGVTLPDGTQVTVSQPERAKLNPPANRTIVSCTYWGDHTLADGTRLVWSGGAQGWWSAGG